MGVTRRPRAFPVCNSPVLLVYPCFVSSLFPVVWVRGGLGALQRREETSKVLNAQSKSKRVK